jgi:hypothetical protein
MAQNCQTCKFYQAGLPETRNSVPDPANGVCRIVAPVITPLFGRSAQWPTVPWDQWCGQWKQRGP